MKFIFLIFYQLFFYLKRKVAKESRFKGNGVSIPFPLKNPLSLNDQRVSDPLESFSRRHNASAVLCGFAFSSNGCFVRYLCFSLCEKLPILFIKIIYYTLKSSTEHFLYCLFIYIISHHRYQKHCVAFEYLSCFGVFIIQHTVPCAVAL